MKKWLVLWCACVPLWAAPPAGKVLATQGKVMALSSQKKMRALRRGSEIYSGDVIRSGSNGKAQLRLSDGTLYALAPNTEFDLELYRYQSRRGEDRSVARLVKGGLRSLTGQIGKEDPSHYELKTPVASIGVRGTSFLVHARGRVVDMEVESGRACLGDICAGDQSFSRFVRAAAGKISYLKNRPGALRLLDAAFRGDKQAQAQLEALANDNRRLASENANDASVEQDDPVKLSEEGIDTSAPTDNININRLSATQIVNFTNVVSMNAAFTGVGEASVSAFQGSTIRKGSSTVFPEESILLLGLFARDQGTSYPIFGVLNSSNQLLTLSNIDQSPLTTQPGAPYSGGAVPAGVNWGRWNAADATLGGSGIVESNITGLSKWENDVFWIAGTPTANMPTGLRTYSTVSFYAGNNAGGFGGLVFPGVTMVTGSLNVDFDANTVTLNNMRVTDGLTNRWDVTNKVASISAYNFNFGTVTGNITVGPFTGSAFTGSMVGDFVGDNANHAIVGFNFQENGSLGFVNGVAAFSP